MGETAVPAAGAGSPRPRNRTANRRSQLWHCNVSRSRHGRSRGRRRARRSSARRRRPTRHDRVDLHEAPPRVPLDRAGPARVGDSARRNPVPGRETGRHAAGGAAGTLRPAVARGRLPPGRERSRRLDHSVRGGRVCVLRSESVRGLFRAPNFPQYEPFAADRRAGPPAHREPRQGPPGRIRSHGMMNYRYLQHLGSSSRAVGTW
jgi:hypothetical protein